MAAAIAARVEGRRRWVERMREAKAAGLIERFPGGRKSAGEPSAASGGSAAPLGGDTLIAGARRAIAKERTMRKPLEPVDYPHAELESAVVAPSHGERLNHLTGRALDTLAEVLDMPTDATNLKLLSIKKDAALSVLGAQIRIDATKVRHSESINLLKLLDCIRDGKPAEFLDA